MRSLWEKGSHASFRLWEIDTAGRDMGRQLSFHENSGPAFGAINSAILNATTPLMGALIGFGFFGEKLTVRKWLGVALGLVGITMITHVGDVQSASGAAMASLACLIATSCYSVAGFLTQRWISERGGLDPKIVAFGSQAGATLFLMPIFIGTLNNGPLVQWAQPEAWISVLAVGLLCTALAYILYFRLIADIGPLRTMTVTFLIPPFGALWGYLALGEIITKDFIAGAVMVGIAVGMVLSPGKPPRIVNRETVK
ncbi:EamA-like transporter family protein [Pseudomonas duriflava]|uniref:EamA-like transporter family protein n=1 Tax=Pseudomonas duriflava TaxID=459528 RepID=A0A562PXT7_9PSED|nr:EamA-like transporter family protein [Pseudomonas duriflava]